MPELLKYKTLKFKNTRKFKHEMKLYNVYPSHQINNNNNNNRNYYQSPSLTHKI